jgi:surface polysaccharide O-acyltransferase-like enzyme
MLFLHLFCRKDVDGLYKTFFIINDVPLIYYLALFGDACVPIYCFASGYGLFVSNVNDKNSKVRKNFMRISRLLINYWIVLVVFVAIGFLAGKSDMFPGSLSKLLLNVFLLSNSYNGAWWFLQTYIILVILSSSIIRLVNKYNSIIIIMVSSLIYLVTYIQRIKQVFILGDNLILNIFVNAIVLVGTSQLPFLVGNVFAKEKLYSKLSSKVKDIRFRNTLCLTSIFALIIIHSIYESMIIAPITGIFFICFFNLTSKPEWLKKLLAYFAKHSTNIWLIHMFFYSSIFKQLTFAPKYPMLIFIWLIVLCLGASYIINLIYKPIIMRTFVKKDSNYSSLSVGNL